MEKSKKQYDCLDLQVLVACSRNDCINFSKLGFCTAEAILINGQKTCRTYQKKDSDRGTLN